MNTSNCWPTTVLSPVSDVLATIEGSKGTRGFQSPEQDQRRRRTSRCELAYTEPYLQDLPGKMPLDFFLDRSDLRLNEREYCGFRPQPHNNLPPRSAPYHLVSFIIKVLKDTFVYARHDKKVYEFVICRRVCEGLYADFAR